MMAERERNIVNAADSYVAIDLETTGIGAKREKITEIGMVKVENGAVTDTYHTLVNPGRPIPEHITELTGIDDDMVKDAPMIQDVIGEVIAFCGTLPALGHQIMFDYGFLVQAAVNGKLRFERSGIDTLKLPEIHAAGGKEEPGGGLRLFPCGPGHGSSGPFRRHGGPRAVPGHEAAASVRQ